MTTSSAGDMNSPTNYDRALVAAATLFAERGFAGTTVDDLIQAAPNAAVRDELRRFPSKSTLAAAVLTAANAGFPFVTFKDNGAESEGLIRIGICCHAVAHRFQREPLAQASLRLKRDAALIDVPVPKPFLVWISLIEEMLDDAVAAGHIRRDTATHEAAWLLVVSFSGIVEASLLGGENDFVHNRIDMLLGAAFTFLGAPDAAAVVREARSLAGH